MGTELITKLLRTDPLVKPFFGGVYASNQLPHEVMYPGYYVMNTDPHYKPGEHWIAAYFTDDGQVEYFDSYGRPPTGPIKCWLYRQSWNMTLNKYQLQGLLTAVCGQYCVFYIKQKAQGLDLIDIINMFDGSPMDSDHFVYHYINDLC